MYCDHDILTPTRTYQCNFGPESFSNVVPKWHDCSVDLPTTEEKEEEDDDALPINMTTCTKENFSSRIEVETPLHVVVLIVACYQHVSSCNSLNVMDMIHQLIILECNCPIHTSTLAIDKMISHTTFWLLVFFLSF